jgi:ATP-binding cassette, subfamily B, bacterial
MADLPETAPTTGLPALLAGDRRRQLARLVALGLAQAGLAAAAAIGVRWWFDTSAQDAGGADHLAAVVGVAALAVAGLQVALRVAVGQGAEALGQHYVAAVRLALLAHVFTLAPRDHQRLRHGHLMARMTGDLAALRRWAGSCLAPLVAAASMLVLAGAVLCWVAPVLAAVGLLAGVAAMALAWQVSARLELALRAERHQRWALAGQVGERLAEAAVVQAHGQARRELRRLGRLQQRLQGAAVQRARWSAVLQSLPVAVSTGVLGAAAAWGAWQVSRGDWSPGTLAGLLTLLGLALAPLRDLAVALGGWRAWRVSREKLASFLALPPLAGFDRTAALRAPDGHLVLRDVDVPGALAAVRIDVPACASLALYGPSGSGKSVLLAVCAGLVAPTRGRVLLDGQLLADCSQRTVALRIALVSADLPLLRGTIASNLRYRRRAASPEQLQQVIARVGLQAAVAALPLGLNSPVGEGGRNLPTVLRHRLCLARALMNDPALLLIDDFDALLLGDEAGDQPLADLLGERRQTVLLATQHPRWQRACTHTLRLLEGRSDPAPRLVTSWGGPLPAKGSAL